MRPILSTFILLQLILGCVVSSYGAHAVSIDGNVKYKVGFKSFDYVDLQAVKRGKIVLHHIGSFDKTNPFTWKGQSPYGLDTLVFEQLSVSSMDEPFTQYGLLAKDIELSEDKMSVTFTLDSDAKFSDGSPVTSSDVGYSLDQFKGDKVHPYYNYYYADISGYTIVNDSTIKILFKKPNRELFLIASQMKVFPEKKHGENGFANNTSQNFTIPVGSGPYVVSKINPGKTITYKRNKDYWAINKAPRAGMFNFDEIVVKYFKDQTVSLEAFKAGEFDFISINIAKQWAKDLAGPKFDSGEYIKRTFPHFNNAGIQGFLMNTRKEIFQDRNVRKALCLALDFSWINRSLFHKQYTRNNSYFSNSYLAAKGLPEGLELQYLLEFRELLPAEVFDQPLESSAIIKENNFRKNLLLAKELLSKAGWSVKEGRLTNKQGEPFDFEILLSSQTFERVMASYAKNLKKLGITAKYRTIDPALYMERLNGFDFDMIVNSYGQSLSPGNEQRNYWHSSAAKTPGSHNYAGINSDVIDTLIEKIIYAKTRQELTSACHALDRVLWFSYYIVPNWYLDVHRIGYKNIFSLPSVSPKYYDPFQLLMTWWMK